MAIVNKSTVYCEKVDINRNQIEHRATWMGLTYDEARKAGVDLEKITRSAIDRTGTFHGTNFKKACKDPEDLREFEKVFLNDVGKSTFQMDVTESTKDDLKIEFHYCPLVNAWKKQGLSDADCEKLCDMAMDGDRAIAKAMGLKLELPETIAKGCAACKLHFHK